MNKKGMALSTILYTLLVLFLSLLFGILGLVNSARITLNKLKKEVINNLNNYEPIVDSEQFLCRRATTLHTEECSWTVEDVLKDRGYETEEEFEAEEGYPVSEDIKDYYCTGLGYTASGSKGTTTITYGNEVITPKKLNSGDAFDCDVNGDGNYNPETERFYYVSDYYNTTTQSFETDKATLIYYNNTTEGVSDNTSASLVAYNSDNKNYLGPTNAIDMLPRRNQWTNPNLITGNRAIIGQNGELSTTGGTLPTAFDYSNYAARLLTTQELSKGCGDLKIDSYTPGGLDICNYLLENTKYSSFSIGTYGYWLETPRANDSFIMWDVHGISRGVYNCNASNDCNIGARPAITVLKSNIDY